ncbi:hypothetical protein VUR80DRAFT_2010 [Thermomyces stellatus]
MGKLFSRSSKSSRNTSENPYAQTPESQDPYADNSSKTSMSSYSNKSSAGFPSGPRAGLPSGPKGGAPVSRPAPSQQPSQQPPPSYGSSVSGGYAPNKYGSGGGYGANRYQNEQSFRQNQNAPVTSQPFRPGGYGGLGGSGLQPQPPGGLDRTDSTSTDADRGNLFGGAKDRYQAQHGNIYDPAAKPTTGYGQSGASAVGSGSYGGYGEPRELTQEEKEEEELQNTKAQIRYIRDETLSSTNRSLQQMQNAMDAGQDTLARLAYQGERLHNADKNMDLAENHNTSGYEKAKELQTVNRSMFAVHVSNPFTAKKRAQARDEQVMERHRAEKSQREATRAAHWQEARLMENSQRIGNLSIEDESFGRPQKANSKYMFEESDDEEEQEKEKTIDGNLGLLLQGAKGLHQLATNTGEVLDEQNRIIDRIAVKTDRVDDGVRRNRLELDKVR